MQVYLIRWLALGHSEVFDLQWYVIMYVPLKKGKKEKRLRRVAQTFGETFQVEMMMMMTQEDARQTD